MRNYYQSRIIRRAVFAEFEGCAYLRRWCLLLSRADSNPTRQADSCQGIPVLETVGGGLPIDKNTGSVGHDAVRKAVQ